MYICICIYVYIYIYVTPEDPLDLLKLTILIISGAFWVYQGL